MKREVLISAIAYHPNVGGVETHLTDLAKELVDNDWFVHILTYQPLETSSSGKWVEKGKNLSIIRLPIMKKFFYKLVKKPVLEFLFLEPLMFLSMPYVLLVNPKIKTVSAQGLVAGAAGVFWGKLFGKKVVISFHSIYHFPKSGMYVSFVKWMLNSCTSILTLSEQSKKEIESLGINPEKVKVFTYWVNQSIFKPMKKEEAKQMLGLKNIFITLFVGRLVKEKGVDELLDSFKHWNKNICLIVAGTGPLEESIEKLEKDHQNLKFVHSLAQHELPIYYNAADIVIIPSTHEEGFGRVILEALSCGTPVIGSNRGGIVEAIDDSVGKLIQISPKNITTVVEYYYQHPQKLSEKQKNAVAFAKKYYSKSNAHDIMESYE